MKRFTMGDKSQSICNECENLVSTTFQYKDVPFDDGNGCVKNILVACCDLCSGVVAVPPQSTPAIKAARQVAIKPIELNLPAPYVDILDLAAYVIDSDATAEFRKTLLMYYLHQCGDNKQGREDIKLRLEALRPDSEVFPAMPKRRISLKITPRLNDLVIQLTQDLKVKKTELIKGLIMKIDDDIVNQNQPHKIEEFRRLAFL